MAVSLHVKHFVKLVVNLLVAKHRVRDKVVKHHVKTQDAKQCVRLDVRLIVKPNVKDKGVN